MRHAILKCCFLFVFISSPVYADSKQQFLSFTAWKSSQVQQAFNQLLSLKAKARLGRRDLIKQVGSAQTVRIRQAEFALDAAKELSVSEYLVMYLNPSLKKGVSPGSLANKLGKAEIAALLSAYSELLEQNSTRTELAQQEH